MNKVNKLKYFAKWIEIQKVSLKSLWTSEQGEQSEQTQIVSQIIWDSQSFIQILKNMWTSEQSEQIQILCQMNWNWQIFIQILENKWTSEQSEQTQILGQMNWDS